jgi:hypothetical protein
MIKLYDQASGELLGEVTEQQFQVLENRLEEESVDDRDYYLNRATLELLGQAGADPHLLELLRRGMGDREEMDIRWSRA